MPARPGPPPRLLLGLLAAAVLFAPLAGCGCRVETEVERAARLAQEEAERLEREKKELEEQRRSLPLLLGPVRTAPWGGDAASAFVKPGHWNGLTQSAKANAEDFDGTVTFEVPRATQGGTQRLVTRQPLVVARESAKAIDSMVFLPADRGAAPSLLSMVRDRRTGVLVAPEEKTRLRALRDHQFHLVVLGREPDRYAFLESLHCVTSRLPPEIEVEQPAGWEGAMRGDKNYRVVAVAAGDPTTPVGLPDNALAWTPIALVVWDDVDPAALSSGQRDALVDWINWGGQLLVSGPNSLELLRGSFLEPLLPARGGPTREATPDEVDRFEGRWSVSDRGKGIDRAKPWPVVTLEPAAGSAALPGLKGLAVERRVGRGRVVVTAFSLREPRLLAWSRGFENFVNAGLLRRPARRFVRADPFADTSADTAAGVEVAARWADGANPWRFDPRANSGVRLFTRDSGLDPAALATTLEATPDPSGEDTGFRSLRAAKVPGGVAAVDDFGPLAAAARDALRSSAGVSVPGTGFVLGCLVAYLLVLVPANWALFAALGRVELAWVAAPVIAILGAWGVIYQARLDIGFVRSRTEVAVLETQPDTPRGVLTRFTALYTSLATTYELEYANPAVAQPFRRGADVDSFGPPPRVTFERQERSRLKDLYVASASTEFVRSDELLDVAAAGVAGSSVPGSVRLAPSPTGAPRIENRTGWTLLDAVFAVRPDGLRGDPRLEGCWLGDIPPGEVRPTVLLPINAPGRGEAPFASDRADAARLRRGGAASRIGLDGLLARALDPADFEPGERRVVAIVGESLPGLVERPTASQRAGATLLVVHLGYGPLPPPTPDENAPLDVR